MQVAFVVQLFQFNDILFAAIGMSIDFVCDLQASVG